MVNKIVITTTATCRLGLIFLSSFVQSTLNVSCWMVAMAGWLRITCTGNVYVYELRLHLIRNWSSPIPAVRMFGFNQCLVSYCISQYKVHHKNGLCFFRFVFKLGLVRSKKNYFCLMNQVFVCWISLCLMNQSIKRTQERKKMFNFFLPQTPFRIKI